MNKFNLKNFTTKTLTALMAVIILSQTSYPLVNNMALEAKGVAQSYEKSKSVEEEFDGVEVYTKDIEQNTNEEVNQETVDEIVEEDIKPNTDEEVNQEDIEEIVEEDIEPNSNEEIVEEDNISNESMNTTATTKFISPLEAQNFYNTLINTNNKVMEVLNLLGYNTTKDINNVKISNLIKSEDSCSNLTSWCGLSENIVHFPQEGIYPITIEYNEVTLTNYVMVSPYNGWDDLFQNEYKKYVPGVYSGNMYYQGPDYRGDMLDSIPEYAKGDDQSDGPLYVYYDEDNPKTARDIAGDNQLDSRAGDMGIFGKYDVDHDKEKEGLGYHYISGPEPQPIDYTDEDTRGMICPYVKDVDYVDDVLPQSTCDTVGKVDSFSLNLFTKIDFNNIEFIPYFFEDADITKSLDYKNKENLLAFDSIVEPGTYEVYYMIKAEVGLPVLGISEDRYFGISSREDATGVTDTDPLINMGHPEFKTDLKFTVEVVDDKQFLAANDVQVSQAFAPKSESGLLNLINAHSVEVEEVVDRHREEYIGKSYEEGLSIIDDGGYDYDNPKVGSYGITIESKSPITGIVEEKTVLLEVLSEYDGAQHSGELLLNTPIAVDKNFSVYDVLEQAKPVTVLYENNMFDYVVDELENDLENILIEQTDLHETGDSRREFFKVRSTYNGQDYENILEVQYTGDDTPITDEITIDAIDPLTIYTGDDFDPLKTPNIHAYNSDDEEEDVTISKIRVHDNNDNANEAPYQLLVESKNDDAYGVRLIDVYATDLEDGEVPLIAASDAKSRSAFAPDNEQELIDLMNVKVIDSDDEDISDLVQVFDTGGFEYGNSKLTGTPYEITLGFTSPATGVTRILTRDLSIIGNSEDLPSVEIAGNEPVYVKLADGTDTGTITTMIDPDILLYLNYEMEDVLASNVTLIEDDAYNNKELNTYHFLYEGVYDEPKSDIDPMVVSNIFDVEVTDDIDKTTVPLKISADEDVKLLVGDDFDPLTTPNVSALSMNDGDVTKDIQVITNNVDTTKAGEYQVSYYVTDSKGYEATKNIMVNVYDSQQDLDQDVIDKDNNQNTSSDNLEEDSEHLEETLTNTATTNFGFVISFSLITLIFVVSSKKFLK